MRLLFITAILSLLGACGFVGFPGVYKIDVEQGNIVTQETADQLEPGMSKRQVRFILGTPLVEDTFSPQRWDYIYVKRNGQDILAQSKLTVEFEGDTLTRVSGDELPAAWGEIRENPAVPLDVPAVNENADDTPVVPDEPVTEPVVEPIPEPVGEPVGL